MQDACKSASLAFSSSRAMWPSRVRSPSWWLAPLWAPAAASCRSHQHRLLRGVSPFASSSGRGTRRGCCSPSNSTQIHRNWGCRSATAGYAWPSTARDDRNQRSRPVSPHNRLMCPWFNCALLIVSTKSDISCSTRTRFNHPHRSHHVCTRSEI